MERARRRPAELRGPWSFGFDQHAIHLHVAGSHLEPRGQSIQKLPDDAVAVHSNHAAMRPGHSHVGDISRALRKKVFIGGSHVGVRADDSGHPAVKIPAHGDLLAGGFRMHVHKHQGDIFWNSPQFAVGFPERIVDRSHEHTPLQIQHGIFHTILSGSEIQPAARIAFRKICRSQQPRLMRQVFQDLFAVPAVVSAGEYIDTHVQKLVRQPWRDPKSRSRILAVGDHQIDLPHGDDVSEAIVNDLPSRRADDVSYEKYAHELFDTAKHKKWSGPLGRGELGREPLK